MNQQTEKDPFLHKLLQQSTMEEPSADFTHKLMTMIQSAESVEVKESFVSRYAIGLLSGFALLAFIAVFCLFPQYFYFINKESLLLFTKPYISMINEIFIFVKSQPIVMIIIFSLAGLFVFDKLLSRLFHSKMQHI